MGFFWIGLATASAGPLDDALNSVSSYLEQHSPFGTPAFDPSDLEKMSRGETVWKDSKKPTGETLLTIGGLIEASPAAVWIAILDDDHNGLSERVIDRELTPRREGYKSLYQHISLPYPLSDRHWIIEIQTDHNLYQVSQKRIWRRGWDLDPRGEAALSALSPEDQSQIRSGVWTPANEGEWLVIPTGEHCTVIYRGRFDVGGKVPESIAQAVGNQGALDLFNQLQELANQMPGHYKAGHPPILAPTGQNIPPW